MKRRAVPIALTVLLGLGGGFYFLFIGRGHEHVEANGWVLDWSYVRVACRTCSGNIERLEYAGTPIQPPVLQPPTCVVSAFTPVGTFTVYPELAQWFYSTPVKLVATTGPAIEPMDLARGWYEMAEPYYSHTLYQRVGTPAHWALVSAAQSRWCEPRLIGECAVAVSQPPATQTSPAE